MCLFPGTDPMSDFRGMGVLSLVQLNYFADKYQVEAQRYDHRLVLHVLLSVSLSQLTVAAVAAERWPNQTTLFAGTRSPSRAST